MAAHDDIPSIPGIEGLELIGRGGFAVVYRGHQPAFRRDVAVKVLLRSGLDADDRRRFDRECQAMGTLSEHPGIVTLYDAGFTDDGRPYLVMAYVAEGTLGDHLATKGAMTWQEATALGVRLAGALETAHRAGVLHRDIKPANVLRARYGAQLSDFGIARIAGGHETRSGLITASIAHAAPEILDGHPPTFQADVYGLASTLYEALTGRAAFIRDTDEGLLPLIRRVVTENPPDLREQGLPDQVVSVIETAMAKDPADRHETAQDFGLALRGAQALLGIPVTDLVIVAAPAGAIPPTAVNGTTPTERHDGVDGAVPPTTGTPTEHVTGSPTEHHTGTPTEHHAGTPTGAVPPTAVTGTPTEHHDGTPSGAVPPTTVTPTGGGPGAGGPAGATSLIGGAGSTAALTSPPGGGRSVTDDAAAEPGGNSKRALAIVGAFVGLIALVIGLVVFTRDDGGPTAGPGTDPVVPTTEATDGSEPGTETTVATETTTETTAPDTTEVVDPGPGLRLGLATAGADGTHPINAGLERAASELGATVERTDPAASTSEQLFELIANGATTVVVLAEPGNRAELPDAVVASADAHPDVAHVVVDAAVVGPNVTSFAFAEHEGSFLVGAAAALTSTTGRVAFLGGNDTDAIRRYEAGYVAGVRHVSPTTQVDVRYLPDTGEVPADDAEVEALANALYGSGADVVYHAGTNGAGLFAAAASTPGRWSIGVDVDQALTVAPEVADSVLTSMVKRYDDVAYQAVIDAAQGALPDGVQELGVAAGGVGWATTGGHVEAIEPDLTALADDIAAGLIVVPSTVERRALAPIGPSCPPEGCQVRIIGVAPSGSELALTLEANWVLDTAAMHVHYFFSPRYSAAQVGGDSTARFGVPVGDWDLDDSYPVYVTEGAVALAGRGSDTEICVTGADAAHNVLDPNLFDCAPIP